MERRLAAVFAADIVNYSLLMGLSEEDAHRRVGVAFERTFRVIEKSNGSIFTFAGDGLMAEFRSTVDAVKCAARIQADSVRRNADLPPDRRILLRIGISVGEILVQDGRVGGNTVNIASRLESLSAPGGICVSAAVYEQVRRAVAAPFEIVGERKLKNIREPVLVYAISPAACSNSFHLTSPDEPVGPPVTLRERDDYRPSLAVLPFRTLQKNQSDAYFAEGMIDDIIRALSGLNDLLVVSRSATLGFGRTPVDVRRIGPALDVQYVLHGSVRREGGSLRIAVELSGTRSGNVIWADRFDGRLEELFELQDRIAARVATAIAPEIRQQELTRAMRKHPSSMTAYDLTLQALDLFYRLDRPSLLRALDLLRQASDADPEYALAHSHAASLHMRRIGQGWSDDIEADRVRASEAARRALDRDPNEALALAIYGHLQAYLFHDFDLAQDYLERAMNAGPSCAWAWAYSSLTCGYRGDTATAIERGERAVRLSPVGPEASWLDHYLSQAYYLDGRFEDAVSWGRNSFVQSPSNASNVRSLIASLVAAGAIDEARAMAAHLVTIAPESRVGVFIEQTPLRGTARDVFAERLRTAGVPD